MSIDVSPIPNYVPNGFKTINIVMPVRNALRAIEFYNRAFNAEEIMRLTDTNGIIVRAEIKISDTILILTEEDPLHNSSPASLGGTSIILQLYVGDVDAFVENALIAGCEVIIPVKKQFYGDKAGRLKDPFGHQWIISTHIEDVTAKEMQKRFNELYA